VYLDDYGEGVYIGSYCFQGGVGKFLHRRGGGN